MNTLPQRLKMALKAEGKSQTDLANNQSVTPQAVQHWCNETEPTRPREKRLRGISEYLNCDFVWLSTGTGTMVEPESIRQQISHYQVKPESEHRKKLINLVNEASDDELKDITPIFEAALKLRRDQN